MNKYYFENDISNEEITYLKSIVKCNTTKKVGFYFTKNIKNINYYVKSKYSRACLACCEIKLFISTQYIEGVSACISSIINFLLEQDIKEYYSIITNKFTETNYKMMLYEPIYNIMNEGLRPDTYTLLSHDLRLINFVEIINNNVVSFNCQYIECGKRVDALDHRKCQIQRIKDDCEIIFETNKEYCNLINQYKDFIDSQRETSNKKQSRRMTKIFNKNSTDSKLQSTNPINCISSTILTKSKIITVVDKQYQYDIEFTNYYDSDQINSYLEEEFGQGRLSYKVDLKDNKTSITYVLN